MNKYKFEDQMKIVDNIGPKGVVAFYENGKLLFRKENMITNIGREYVFYHFLKSFMGSDDNDTSSDISSIASSFNNEKLDSFALGSGGSMTTPETTELDTMITDFGGNGDDEDGSGYISFGDSINFASKELNITHTISDIGTSHIIQELGLFIGKTHLFSRVTFDPIPINPGSNYELEYTIYF